MKQIPKIRNIVSAFSDFQCETFSDLESDNHSCVVNFCRVAVRISARGLAARCCFWFPYQKTILKISTCISRPQFPIHAVYPWRKWNNFQKAEISRVETDGVIVGVKHFQISSQIIVLRQFSAILRPEYWLAVFPAWYWGCFPYQKTIFKSSTCISHPQFPCHAVCSARKWNKFEEVALSWLRLVIFIAQHFWIRNRIVVLVSSISFEFAARISVRGLTSVMLRLSPVSKMILIASASGSHPQFVICLIMLWIR